MFQKHKLFLHQLLKCGVLPITKALQFCKDIKADEVKNLASLKEFAAVINNKITEQDFKIVLNVCEITGQQQVILINTANDEISKLQNVFSILQLEFFQKILQEIVITAEKKLSQIYCLNLSTKLTGKLSQSDVEKVLDKWTKMGYLVKHDSDIFLGSRCITEFTSFFKSYCKDYVQDCSLCSELVFKGKDCISCKKLIHTHCLKKFLEKHNSCPECNIVWKDREIEFTQNCQHNLNSEDEENDPGPSRRKRLSRT